MDARTASAEAEIRERLGVFATGAGRDVRALAALVEDEVLHAVAVAMWRRRGWVVAATDRGLRLARRPLLFGRGSDERYGWADLTGVTTGPQRVELSFGAERLHLGLAGPEHESVRLVETARDLGGLEAPVQSVEELRELARRKLGRAFAAAYGDALDALPDRLEPEERVERLAIATLGFSGLLVLTDRRVLLLHVGFRASADRIWSTDRAAIRGVADDGDGLRLELATGPLTLARILPPDRRDELASVLWRHGSTDMAAP